ncbi:O-antigen polymerase [Acidovorax sp. KKS102]|uniref:PglL family O-oligosaccharyltransferase n=1 Tax=Acidovorax sp. KKS102 TaxID=358220 RepID=UPI00028AA407|nr:O-antigen ligase family protein [Acidovorax sp. KKS102]AFU48344.1 O-antigen polymerase [Acidovorax sp. KKS102]
MNYVLGLSLLMCCFLQSFSALPWRSAHSELFAFFAVLAWAWGVARRIGVFQVRLSSPILVLLGLSVLISIQYVSGQIEFGGDAIILLLYVFLCISALLVAQWHGDDAVWPVALALALLITALASTLIALTQALGVWGEAGWIVQYSGFRRPGANLGQPNHLATLLVMGAASLIYLNQRLSVSRPVTILLSLVLFVGMGVAESRTGLLSGLALCFWWFARRRVLVRALYWPWIATCALALIAIMWVWPPLISHIHEAGTPQKGVTINTSAGIRVEVWQQLWDAMWIKPWLGWGLRGVSTALNAVQHNYVHSSPFTYAHNIILDMMIGMGIPLTALVVCAASVWMWQQVRNVETTRSWYAVGLLIPLGIHSLFEYPFAYAYFLVPAMLAIGMLGQQVERSMTKIVSSRILYGMFFLFGLVLVWLSVEYLNIEEDFRIARFESINLGQTPAGYEQPNTLLLTQLKAMIAATRTVPRPLMAAEEIDLLRAATLRFPWVPVQNTYALSLALNGNSPEAIRQLKVLRAAHGEKVYEGVKATWVELAQTKFPQLKVLALP